MRKLILALPAILCACAAPYAPQTIEPPEDPVQYAKDVDACVAAGKAYRPQADLASIGAATINGAANNASEAVINPLVPVVGAAGGAAGSLATTFDLNGLAKRNVAKHCLIEKTRRDHSAIVADPDN